MNIGPIFTVIDTADCWLWSVYYDRDEEIEYEKLMENWTDAEWIHSFLEQNKDHLFTSFWKGMTMEEAADQILEEAFELDTLLYELEQHALKGGKAEWRDIFSPLDNREYVLRPHRFYKGKVPGYRQLLRLYAICLEDGSFIITGGAIKLTHQMTTPELERELEKLDLVKRFLKNNDIFYKEDIND